MQFVFVAAVLAGAVAPFGLGIDWGSEFHKSSFILPGSHFRAVENQISKRKTHNMISFCGDERFFEAQASFKYPRKNCQTFSMINHLLYDLKTLDPAAVPNAEVPYIGPFRIHKDKHGVAVGLDSSDLFTKLNITRSPLPELGSNYLWLEELLAMVMERNLYNANITAGQKFT